MVGIAEVSCRKYLNAIAAIIGAHYTIMRNFKSGFSIGDVLSARKGKENDLYSGWTFIPFYTYRYEGDGSDDDVFEVLQVMGDGSVGIVTMGLNGTPLPDLFSEEEWKRLEEFNEIHFDGIENDNFLETPNGRPYIVLPHLQFADEETTNFWRSIGTKVRLLPYPDRLVIRDENDQSLGTAIDRKH